MKYRIEVVINEDSAENVVLYFLNLSDGFGVARELLRQGYVLKITAEVDE